MAADFAVWVAALMLGVNAWFVRRLIVSVDTFKRDVYLRLSELALDMARTNERHRIEDAEGVLFFHRRASDKPS